MEKYGSGNSDTDPLTSVNILGVDVLRYDEK
jgi:hypothetical protein